MNTEQAYDIFSPIQSICSAAPSAYMLASRNGKLQYIAANSFCQVQNEFTAQLPDFMMNSDTLNYMLYWLKANYTIVTVQFKKISDNILELSTEDSVFQVPVMSLTSYYENVDEITLKSLLTNQYSFVVSGSDFQRATYKLRALPELDSAVLSKLTVKVFDGQITFYGSHYITGGYSIKLNLPIIDAELPDKWVSTYTLLPLTKGFFPVGDVKFSFTDHQTKLRSPLLVEDNFGVKLVLAPLWN